MHEFLKALLHPDIPVLRHAVLVGLLSSVAFGIVGSFVVTRRVTFIAAAIAHSVLGGIGAVLYLRAHTGLTWLEPVHGALPAALFSALIIGLVSLRAKEREDTVIGAVWAVGMALGLLLLAKTPGYNKDTMSYLFGDILLITKRDVWMVAGLDILVTAVAVFFYNKLLAVCFDEEFARTRGLAVDYYYLLLLCLIAVTIVLLVYLVGIVLVIALLTLPAAAVQQNGDGFFAWVVNADGKAEMRPLKVAGQIGQKFRITSGVKPGERAITDGAQRVQRGAAVQILN